MKSKISSLSMAGRAVGSLKYYRFCSTNVDAFSGKIILYHTQSYPDSDRSGVPIQPGLGGTGTGAEKYY